MAGRLKHLVGGLVAGATMTLISFSSQAGVVTYSDESLFHSQLGNSFTDNYSDIGYRTGDLNNEEHTDRFSDDAMSAVIGQTRYHTTSFSNMNLVSHSPALGTPGVYCAGCNGSFVLDFSQTSYGTSQGVFGVGFEIDYNVSLEDDGIIYLATVTFGDGEIQDVLLPEVAFTGPVFFGLTSDDLISSIHIGLAGGEPMDWMQGRLFSLFSVTIGDAAVSEVPAPAALGLLLLGLAGIAWRRKV